MAKRTKNRDYDALHAKSGWYLAAWRDYRRLSQPELADEIGTSKSMVSDLENGEKPWSTSWVSKCSAALGTTAGFLIEVNPFGVDVQTSTFVSDFSKLDDRGKEVVLTTLKTALALRSA